MVADHVVVVGYEVQVYRRLPSGECGEPILKQPAKLVKADVVGQEEAVGLANTIDNAVRESVKRA